MAPRRGGGGGFSTSSGSGDSDSTPNVWTEKTELFGTDFHDRYIVAEVVIEAICLFALILIAIWSVTFRKRSESSRAVFRWFRFGAAMSMELVYAQNDISPIRLIDLVPGPSVLASSA